MTEFQQRIQAEAEAMAEMHRAGKKNREIAEAFGCDPATVTYRLKRVGIKASGRMRRHLMEERGDEMVAMAKAGKTDKEIAVAVGCSPQLIPRMLHDLGCETASEIRMKRNAELRRQRKDASRARAEAEKAALLHRAQRMREMAEEGKSSAEIADEFGVCKHTVERWVKEAGLVRGNGWKHAQFVETVTKAADAAGYTIIGDPTRRCTVVRCNVCGSVREIACTTTRDMPSCPECASRKREKREAERAERIARKAARAEANKRRRAVTRLVNLLTPRVCVRCGRVFHSSRAQALKFCSEKCVRETWHDNHIDRARKYGCERDAGITLKKLVERDGLECYLCGKTCDYSDRRWGSYGPDHPTIDHVFPLSRGGGHTWENVRVACGACNAEKRDIILV